MICISVGSLKTAASFGGSENFFVRLPIQCEEARTLFAWANIVRILGFVRLPEHCYAARTLWA